MPDGCVFGGVFHCDLTAERAFEKFLYVGVFHDEFAVYDAFEFFGVKLGVAVWAVGLVESGNEVLPVVVEQFVAAFAFCARVSGGELGGHGVAALGALMGWLGSYFVDHFGFAELPW